MSENNNKQLVEQIGKAIEEFKHSHQASLKERDSLLDEKVTRIADDVETKWATLGQQVESMATKLNRTSVAGDTQAKSENDELKMFISARRDSFAGRNHRDGNHNVTIEQFRDYKKAMNEYIRFGEEGVDIKKTLSVGSDADGGNWISPPTIMQTIINRMFETSPMRMLATVVPISTHSLKIPENPNEFGGGWVAEMTTRTNTTTPVTAMKEIVAQELYAMPPVSQQLLEDSAIDVEQWVGSMAADKLSRVENTAFVSGTGVGQPRGITSYTSGTTWGTVEQVGTGTSGAFTYTGLLNIVTAIKDKYQANASFLLKRGSVAKIMLLTDGNSRYIFQPILNGNFNSTPLLGAPMHYANDMPAVGAGNLSLAYGDFRQAYTIVDRVGISLLRDNLTAKPAVLFYFRKRTGGAVVDFDAYKLQVLT